MSNDRGSRHHYRYTLITRRRPAAHQRCAEPEHG